MSFFAALLLTMASTASGTDSTGTQTPANAKPAEPDQDPLVCRRVEELGSRLKSHKVCMHKSEWAQQRLQDRMMIDRAQVQRPTTGN